MTDTDKSEERPYFFYQIPKLENPQSTAIASEVNALLHSVMEMAHATAEQLRQAVERFGQVDDPEFLLERKKQFLAALLGERKEEYLPEAFFAPLMRITVYEANPSFSRSFVEPCLRAFGYRKVQEALLEYLERGTNREKAGAARAFYWAQLPLLLPSWHDQHRNRKWHDQDELRQAVQAFCNDIEKVKQAFQKMCDEELADLRSTIAITMLKEFVENNDLDVRRSIIPQLSLNPLRYSEEWKLLIPTAIHIARTHPDDYIRHRIEIQLGKEGYPEL